MSSEPSDDYSGSAIHIALNFNDNFWAPAYAVMRSVCLSTKRRRDLIFHLFEDGLTLAHRQYLERIPAEFGARLAFYDIGADADFQRLAGSLPRSARFPLVVNGRLFIDRLLPASVRRVVYLDCDTMVIAPIENLYDSDLGDDAIAAVADPFAMSHVTGRDMRSEHGLFDPAEPFFNSGVMLIDVPRYAAANIPARLVEFERRGVLKHAFFDQDILNLIFAGQWAKLNWRYNVIRPQKSHQAMGPFVVHYTDRRRPWLLFSDVPFHRMYRHVMTNELFYRYAWHRWARALRRLAGGLLGRP